MRILYVFVITLLSCSLSYAAISTTINRIDKDFDNAQALYPIDLDKDGDIDVIGVANNTDNTVDDLTWWENNGSESFTERSIVIDFDEANSVFAIDIDKDGDIDILAAAGGGTDDIAWWANDGSPSNGGWTKYTIDSNLDGANSIYAVDMDKDGDLDVLATAGTAKDVAWWENDGNPKKDDWTKKWTIDAAFDGANFIYAADMDKDGDLDVLATADIDDDVSWWENDGNPKKDDWTNEWVIDSSFEGANSIYAADMDKDGDLDVLATAGTAKDVAWWKNDGNPKKKDWTEYTIDGSFDGAESIYVIDIDFDGDLDVLACANTDDDVSWWENDGNPAKNTWTEHTIKNDFDGASFVYALDLDGDGDIDVLSTADTDNDLAWWKNDANLESGNIGFAAEHLINNYLNGASAVYATDLDIDGDNDIIAVARLADDLIWWENGGASADGGWTEHTIESSFDGAHEVVALDLDRDGDIDIAAVADVDDELAWWENNGSQSFTKKSIDASLNGANSLFIIDLDTDGDLDIIATAGLANELNWWRNNGSQSFTKKSIDASLNGANNVFCIDLDRDGDIDVLATADIADDVDWWENDGSEGFTKRIIDDNFNGATSVIARDLDTDGDIDVIACAYNGNIIAWWANDGSPSDGGWTKYTVDADVAGASDIDSLDVDLDGDIDIVGSAKSDDDIAWWENDGSPSDGGWTKHAIDSSFDGATSVFSLDLDRDGDIDILGAAEFGDDISWWENGGAASVTPTPATRETATPSISIDFTSLVPSTTTGEAEGLGLEGLEEEGVEPEEALQEIDVACFIATASFGTPQAEEIKRLCRFRDEYLMKSATGRVLVNLYYKISPPLANIISRNEPIKTFIRNLIKLLLKISDAFAEEEEFTVGIITLSPAKEYVVAEDTKSKKRRIYEKTVYEKIADKGLEAVQSVTLQAIEYRYKPVKGKIEFISEEFELIELKGKKAVLKRDYVEEPEKLPEQELPPEEEIEEVEIEEEPLEEAPKEEITAKRLLAELFFKIESKKISEYEWAISLPTIMHAAANFTTVLGIVIKKVDALLEPEKKARIYFKTSLGKAALGPEGLLIESLSSRLKVKCGIRDDDLIKTVNGKTLATIQDIAAAFSTFSGSPQTVTVKLIRDEKDLTLTYYIK